ncbi:MAG: ABC transporter permease [Clostridia bacterium]|nr:ABC transporter permease [Clostridia bacterium]
MKRFFEYLFGSFSKKPFLGIVLILQIAISSFIIFSAMFSYMKAKDETESVSSKFKDSFSGSLTFNHMGQTDSARAVTSYMLSGEIEGIDDETLHGYDALYNDLLSIEYASAYYNFDFMSLSYWDPVNKVELTEEKERHRAMFSADDLDPDFGLIDQNGQFHANYVDLRFINAFKLNAEKGRMFTEEDFNYNLSTDEIPIVMGHRFAKYFDIGDILRLKPTMLGRKIYNLRVIGFLPENSGYVVGSNVTSLDCRILLPINLQTYADHIEYNGDLSFTWAFNIYSKIEGTMFIVKNEERELFISEVNSILEKHGLESAFIVNTTKDSAQLLADRYVQMFRIRVGCLVLTLTFSFLTLVFSMLNKILSNIKNYAIYILTGSTVHEIGLFASLESFVYCVLGSILGFMAFSSYYSMYPELRLYNDFVYTVGFSIILLFVVGIAVTVFFVSVLKIQCYDISMLIRGNEVRNSSGLILYKVILFLLTAFVSVCILFIAGYNKEIINADMYSRGFLTKNIVNLTVSQKDEKTLLPEPDISVLGEDVALYKWVTISATDTYPLVRGVYIRGSYPVPEIIEGRFFTENEMYMSDKDISLGMGKIAVMGKTAFDKFGKTLEDGTTVFEYLGDEYTVIGIMGKLDGSATTIDNLVYIPLRTSVMKYSKAGTFTVDSEKEARANDASEKLKEHYGLNAEINNINISFGSVVSAPSDALFALMTLLFLNVAVFSAYYVDRQKHIVSVKKMIGFSKLMIVFDVVLDFVKIAFGGFWIGWVSIVLSSRTILKNIEMFSVVQPSFDITMVSLFITVIAFIVVAVWAVFCTYNKDTSEMLRG